MAAIITAPTQPRVVSVPWWTWPLAATAIVLLWLVTMEASAVSAAIAGTPSFLHELFHDGRHLLGVPCH